MTDDRWYSVARSVVHDAEESVDVEADLAALHQRLAGATVAQSRYDRRRSGRGRLLAVAATVLLVAGAAAVLLTRRDDPDSIATATVTTATVTTATVTTQPPSSTTPSDGDEWLAIANPSVVAPGGATRFAPSRVIERMCTDIAVLLRQTADGWEMMGQILRGIDWVPVVPGVPPTYPPCVGEYSAQALVLIMPTTIDDGTYLVCIGAGGIEEPAGCGRVAVEATTPAASP